MHDLASVIKDTQADSERLYKHFHQNPELSMLETEPVETIVDELESYGYSVQQIGGGVVGVLENGDGETILFRADFDGLPVKEETGLEYASTRTSRTPKAWCSRSCMLAVTISILWQVLVQLESWLKTGMPRRELTSPFSSPAKKQLRVRHRWSRTDSQTRSRRLPALSANTS